jgi:hypothetical protein
MEQKNRKKMFLRNYLRKLKKEERLKFKKVKMKI